MHHVITIGDLMLILCALGGLAAAAIGTLMIFAGGLSDAPAAGEAATRQGCITALSGAVVLGISLYGLFG